MSEMKEPKAKVERRGRVPVALKNRRIAQSVSLSLAAIEKIGEISFREQISLSAVVERIIMTHKKDEQ